MTTTAYNTQRDVFGRIVQWLVEIDLDRCSLTYTQGDCTASDLGDGLRCWYTFPTCQVPSAFDRTTRTLRFCLEDVKWPDRDVAVYPLLRRTPIDVPQSVDPEKLSVFPSQIRVSMAPLFDPPPPDHDKGSAYSNSASLGEFWRTLFARHRNYANRAIRIKRGFYVDGFTLADFEQVGPDYKIKEVKVSRDGCTIIAESPLAELDKLNLPFTTSEDNTLVAGITDSATSLTVANGYEFPDPSDYTRNDVYIKIDDEVMRLDALTPSTGACTVTRARWGTTAVLHDAGAKVSHVVGFGVDNGSSAATGRNSIEILQDILEWAGIDAADVDTDSFDDVKETIWPDDELVTLVTKQVKISKLAREIRDIRGVLIVIDAAGKWACRAIAPSVETPTEYTDDNYVAGSMTVDEDDEKRVTRVALWWSPVEENSTDSNDYSKGVVVISTDSEDERSYGDVKLRVIYDRWLAPNTPTATVRNLARRLLTRLRNGVRTFGFSLELKDATREVGDIVNLNTRILQDARGNGVTRPAVIVERSAKSSHVMSYKALDVETRGRFFRIGPDTMADDYTSAPATDKAYGYFGDTDNRVGTSKEEGYIFF